MIRLHDAQLHADAGRVIARLFLPGEELSSAHSRAAAIVGRVMALSDAQIEPMAAALVRGFAGRHPDVEARLFAHADVVGSRVPDLEEISPARRIVLGAVFTSEYAVEGAALCNPSATPHPDQSGLADGQLRVAVAVREIGEGHRSSIGFAEAVIGPGRQWRFEERARPVHQARIAEGEWTSAHFRAAVEREGIFEEIVYSVLRSLPARFTATDLEAVIAALPGALSGRRTAHTRIDALRGLAASAYCAEFPAESVLSQRVLSPVTAEERSGMEDARFVRVTELDGSTRYRATYTAYDGRAIAPRLIVSADLRDFHIHRLTGDAARDKGMALFPRPIGGRYLALGRADGEDISLASSPDGVVWTHAGIVHTPIEPWEIVQTGNCGPPLETDAGWIVLTHGVGPMREYALGALLLDLDDPTIVRGRTTEPLLQPDDDRRDGYVPNVLYSCGGVIADGVLWIPIGIGDARIGVCSIDVDELVERMRAAPATASFSRS